MRKQFTIYELATGRIVRHCVSTGDVAQQLFPNEAAVMGDYPRELFYIEAGEPRPRQPLAPQVFGSRIVGLPMPCTIEIEGRRYEADDGVAELSFKYPGPYRVRVEADRYLACEVDID